MFIPYKKGLPLKVKLTLMVFLPLFTIVTGGTAFIAYNNYQRLQHEVINANDQFHEIISHELIKLITYDTIDVASEITMRLRRNLTLKSMLVFDKENKAIYEYLKESEDRSSASPEIIEGQPVFTDDTAMMMRKLSYQGVDYGHVLMQVSLENLIATRQNLIQQLLFIALALIFGSAFLAYLLQRYFSFPIDNLSKTIQHITESDDIVIIPESHRNDEIGSLFRGFRKMQKSLIAKDKSLRNNEKRYRQMFETNQAIKLIIDADDGRIVEANKAALNFYGYDLGTITSMTIMDINQLSDDEIKIETQKAISEERLFFNFKHKVASGDIRDVEVYSGPVVLDNKTLLFSIVHDVTERVLAEEALRRSQKMDAIGQLTGGIAHDFNNILSIILGSLSLLEKQIGDDENIKKRIAVIKHGSQRAVDLTRQLLLFSRNEPALLESTDINKVIREMEGLIKHSLTPQIEISYQLDTALYSTAIDSGDFKDALLNILLNAKDAMPEGGKLVIETNNVTLDEHYCSQNFEISAGEYVELAISDNGMGMSKEQQLHIFEPFYTTKEQGRGTGLGMSMVFGFVQRSSGSIKVYSEIGIGTTLRIYLPRDLKLNKIPEIKQTETELHMPRGNETILAVDDEPALLNMVEETLVKLGYTVHTARNGQEALEKLGTHNDIQLLFSDVVMPGGINGYQLAETACKQNPKLKVLLTSGYTGMAISQNGQAQFNTNLLSKPYTLRDLAARIKTTLTDDCVS